MLRQLIYRGDKEFQILFPMNEIVTHGTTLTVDNKKDAEMLMDLGFQEVATGKEEITKKENKTEKEGE